MTMNEPPLLRQIGTARDMTLCGRIFENRRVNDGRVNDGLIHNDDGLFRLDLRLPVEK